MKSLEQLTKEFNKQSLEQLTRKFNKQGKYVCVGGYKCRSKRLRKKAKKYRILLNIIIIENTLLNFVLKENI